MNILRKIETRHSQSGQTPQLPEQGPKTAPEGYRVFRYRGSGEKDDAVHFYPHTGALTTQDKLKIDSNPAQFLANWPGVASDDPYCDNAEAVWQAITAGHSNSDRYFFAPKIKVYLPDEGNYNTAERYFLTEVPVLFKHFISTGFTVVAGLPFITTGAYEFENEIFVLLARPARYLQPGEADKIMGLPH